MSLSMYFNDNSMVTYVALYQTYCIKVCLNNYVCRLTAGRFKGPYGPNSYQKVHMFPIICRRDITYYL